VGNKKLWALEISDQLTGQPGRAPRACVTITNASSSK